MLVTINFSTQSDSILDLASYKLKKFLLDNKSKFDALMTKQDKNQIFVLLEFVCMALVHKISFNILPLETASNSAIESTFIILDKMLKSRDLNSKERNENNTSY